ncbi:MAG: 30S ribosomal protein S4e [Candidatus Woesearchaeota archaeon]
MSRHLKRLNAPKSWAILRKTTKYIAKPLPGAHRLSESMPVSLVLQQLGYAQTSAEAKKILQAHQILVDNRRIKDPKAPVGLLDSISLPGSNEYYRLVFDTKGRLHLMPIPKSEAGMKLCKVVNKTSVAGGKVQLNLSDGRNVLAESKAASTGDTLLLEVPGQKIQQRLALEKGALVYLLGGKHIGTTGVVEKLEGNEIMFTANGQQIMTAKKYALVVGRERPVLTIMKAQ